MAADINGAQIRAARAFLDISAAELAELSGVGLSTVRTIEAVDDLPGTSCHVKRLASRSESLDKIVEALRSAGARFLDDDGKDGPGVRYGRK